MKRDGGLFSQRNADVKHIDELLTLIWWQVKRPISYLLKYEWERMIRHHGHPTDPKGRLLPKHVMWPNKNRKGIHWTIISIYVQTWLRSRIYTSPTNKTKERGSVVQNMISKALHYGWKLQRRGFEVCKDKPEVSAISRSETANKNYEFWKCQSVVWWCVFMEIGR